MVLGVLIFLLKLQSIQVSIYKAHRYLHGFWLEVYVTVQCQQERVVSLDLLPPSIVLLSPESEPEEVIHVHHLKEFRQNTMQCIRNKRERILFNHLTNFCLPKKWRPFQTIRS